MCTVFQLLSTKPLPGSNIPFSVCKYISISWLIRFNHIDRPLSLCSVCVADDSCVSIMSHFCEWQSISTLILCDQYISITLYRGMHKANSTGHGDSFYSTLFTSLFWVDGSDYPIQVLIGQEHMHCCVHTIEFTAFAICITKAKVKLINTNTRKLKEYYYWHLKPVSLSICFRWMLVFLP